MTEAMKFKTGGLLSWQRSLSASPNAVTHHLTTMMEFAVRHGIAPQVEHFPMSQVNAALDHLRANKARYRIVLDADFDVAMTAKNAGLARKK